MPTSGSRCAGPSRRHRSRLCARLVGAVGQLDPPAILHAAQHSPVALRHRLPAPRARAFGRRSRTEGARLSVPGKRRRRGRAAGQPRHPERRGLLGRAARPAALRPALSLDFRRGRRARLARHRQRRLVRRAGADAGLPPQGARAGRPVRRRRGRGAGAQRGHPALGRPPRGAHHRAGGRPVVGRGGRDAPASPCRSSRAAARCSCSMCASRPARRRSSSIPRAPGSGRKAASISAARRPPPATTRPARRSKSSTRNGTTWCGPRWPRACRPSRRPRW